MNATEKATHTPGPWQWFNDTRNRARNISDQPSMKFLVGSDEQGFAHTVGLHEPTDRANADLIAAAPDLLAACKAALGAFDSNNAIDWSDLAVAIEKAEGR